MRARPALLIVLLLAPLAPAGAGEESPYQGRASTCDILRSYRVEVGPPCPHARHEGAASPLGCEGASCAVRVAGMAEGGGVPAARKTLATDVLVDGALRARVCEATASEPFLACAGVADVSFALAGEGCREVRVRTTLVELADVPPHLTVRMEAAWSACRDAAGLRLK